MYRTARRTGQYVQTPNGIIRSQVRVRANGHTGTVTAVNRTNSGRVVAAIEWDDREIDHRARGIAWITRPYKPHHRDLNTLEILP